MKEKNKRGKSSRSSRKEYILLIMIFIVILAFTFLIYKITITARIVEEIQPDATLGKDAFIQEDKLNENKGIYKKIKIDSETTKQINGLIAFDLSSIPSNVTINSATLELYLEKGAAQTYNIDIHRITASWTEIGVTWNSRDGTNNWISAGGDYDSKIFASLSVDKIKGWRSWNITELVKGWKNGTWSNHGMILVPATSIAGNNVKEFISSDDAKKSSYWPKLIVDYTVAPVNDTIAPITTLNNPVDNANLTLQTVAFSCSATDNVQLSNITLYGNWGSGWHANETKVISGTSNTTSFTKTITDSNYRWNCYACDNSSNCNFAPADRTFTIDTTPPGTVTGLSETATSQTWIYWNWTNPSDPDFNQAIIYINGVNTINTSNNYYNATGLSPDNWYTITVHTKDTTGNVNNTDVNDTVKTFAFPCVENWVANYGACLINDSQLKYYIDSNSCGTFNNLPGDNGTYVYCNYCTSTWATTNSSCHIDDTFDIGYYYTNNCCAQTGLPSDCNIPSNTTGICNYCSENITGPFNTTCNSSNLLTQYYIDENYAGCCAITSLASDCHINNGSYNNQTFPCVYDAIPPIISDVSTTTTSNSATITWKTNENANSSINYGTTTALGLIQDNSNLVTSHSITISGLTSSTLYYFNVTSCDISGNCNTTGIYDFTTSASGGGGGGGGGRRAPTPPTVPVAPKAGICDITAPLREYMKGTCKDLTQGSSIYFEIDNEAHSIIINKINANSIEIVIYYSLPHKTTLAIGQSEEVDLDNDGFADISVKLENIKQNQASITVKIIERYEPLVSGVCDCPDCSNWNECIEGRQTRICYECGPETNYICIGYEDEQICALRAFCWLCILIPAAVIAYLIYLCWKRRYKKEKRIKKRKKKR